MKTYTTDGREMFMPETKSEAVLLMKANYFDWLMNQADSKDYFLRQLSGIWIKTFKDTFLKEGQK